VRNRDLILTEETPEEAQDRERRRLANQKWDAEMEMKNFDTMSRFVRDTLNYQPHHRISAQSLVSKQFWMNIGRQRKFSIDGILKLVLKGRTRLEGRR